MHPLITYGLAYIAPIAPLTTLGFVWQASGGLIALANGGSAVHGYRATSACDWASRSAAWLAAAALSPICIR